MSKIKLVGVKVKKTAKKADADIKWFETAEFKKLREDMRAADKRFGNDGIGVFNVKFEFMHSNLSCTAAIDGPSTVMYVQNNSVFSNTLKENMDEVDKYLQKLENQAKVLKRARDYAEKTAAKFQKTIDGFPPEMKKQMKEYY